MPNAPCKEKYEATFNHVNLGIVVNKYMYDFCLHDMRSLVSSHVRNWIKKKYKIRLKTAVCVSENWMFFRRIVSVIISTIFASVIELVRLLYSCWKMCYVALEQHTQKEIWERDEPFSTFFALTKLHGRTLIEMYGKQWGDDMYLCIFGFKRFLKWLWTLSISLLSSLPFIILESAYCESWISSWRILCGHHR